jgi:hypothetical protein
VLATGGRWFAPPPGQARIPLEFSHAAFRYGHSQIRHTYRLARGGPELQVYSKVLEVNKMARLYGSVSARLVEKLNITFSGLPASHGLRRNSTPPSETSAKSAAR